MLTMFRSNISRKRIMPRIEDEETTALTPTLVSSKSTNWMYKIENEVPKVSSLYVAEVTCKRHDNILRDTRQIIAADEGFAILNFEEGNYLDKNKQKRSLIWLTEAGCSILLGGYSIEHRIKVQKELDRLKEEVNSQKRKLPMNYKEALLELVASEEKIEKLTSENTTLSNKLIVSEKTITDQKLLIDIYTQKALQLSDRTIFNDLVRHVALNYKGNNYRNSYNQIYNLIRKQCHIDVDMRKNKRKTATKVECISDTEWKEVLPVAISWFINETENDVAALNEIIKFCKMKDRAI